MGHKALILTVWVLRLRVVVSVDDGRDGAVFMAMNVEKWR